MNTVLCVAWVLGIAWYWRVYLFELINKNRKLAKERISKLESSKIAVDGLGRTASEKPIALSETGNAIRHPSSKSRSYEKRLIAKIWDSFKVRAVVQTDQCPSDIEPYLPFLPALVDILADEL